MLTAGIDLAAQPKNTGAVVVDWSTPTPTVRTAEAGVGDARFLELCAQVRQSDGKVGTDCPLGWPRAFVQYVSRHAAREPLPPPGSDPRELRLRTTDLMQRDAGHSPLSASTDKLGSVALRVARLLEQLGQPNRDGSGLVCEVYPMASRRVWGLVAERRSLDAVRAQLPLQVAAHEEAALTNEHIFDALIAALAAYAVHQKQTAWPSIEQAEIAAEEGWMHVPPTGHRLADLLG